MKRKREGSGGCDSRKIFEATPLLWHKMQLQTIWYVQLLRDSETGSFKSTHLIYSFGLQLGKAGQVHTKS